MPAKRKPKKSRLTTPTPSLSEVNPPDLDTIEVAPAIRPTGSAVPQAPKAGPPRRGTVLPAGRGRTTGSNRQYAFRRS